MEENIEREQVGYVLPVELSNWTREEAKRRGRGVFPAHVVTEALRILRDRQTRRSQAMAAEATQAQATA